MIGAQTTTTRQRGVGGHRRLPDLRTGRSERWRGTWRVPGRAGVIIVASEMGDRRQEIIRIAGALAPTAGRVCVQGTCWMRSDVGGIEEEEGGEGVWTLRLRPREGCESV